MLPPQQINKQKNTPPHTHPQTPLNYKPSPFLFPSLVPAALPLLLAIRYFSFPEVAFRVKSKFRQMCNANCITWIYLFHLAAQGKEGFCHFKCLLISKSPKDTLVASLCRGGCVM